MKRMLVALVAGGTVAGHVPFPAPVHAQGGVRYSITPHGSVMLTASGQVRLRGETWQNFGAGQPDPADLDDTFGLARIMLRTGLNMRDRLELGLELKSSLASHRTLPGGVRTADEDRFDLQQAYIGVAVPAGRGTLAARAGRFDLAFGRERLVGPSDWTNTRRTFQGASLHASGPRGDITLFWTRPVTVRRRTPNVADSTRQLYGAYLSRARGPRRAELYWLRSESGLGAGFEKRHTLGGRLLRAPAAGRFDAEIEAALQDGRIGTTDIGAWMATAVVGRSFAGGAAARVYAAVDAASGGAAGGKLQTFSQLYPTGHAHLGYIDLHGRQNVIAVSAGASLRPAASTTVALDLFSFRRASGEDALYDAGGAAIRPAGTSLPLAVGQEIDLTLRRAFRGGRLTLQAGGSVYLAGPFLEQSGRSGNVGWAYGQVTAAF